ncbi:bifunctional phosphoribosyl-AMP cyclohydrolase/phosphoribosyl-ATP diphosphatase HisIE [Buchnera aphidicola (Neophyllaphis podocarpi)]|uniref:bifunctional phosphoribosyl-AMP cyclohydrolase/phosphoribosyl-ATP diphosphatase HisIE n=1 Tax=Buchnera aphidicola TaxID=9 RepID=UPI0031B866B7
MLNINELHKINWDKTNGMIPSIIQDNNTGLVLMHGYLNKKALTITIQTKKVTFYSRTKKRLWTKGETSGNFLVLKKIILDCDHDSLLLFVDPINNTCHLNNLSCFFSPKFSHFSFLNYLEKFLIDVKNNNSLNSYTNKIYNQGIKRLSQKVGEEGLEVALASLSKNKQEVVDESSDLIYHLLLLLLYHNLSFNDIIKNLQKRHNKKNI